jgi:hypothetical protein
MDMQSNTIIVNKDGQDFEITGEEALTYIASQEALALEVQQRDAAQNQIKQDRVNVYKKLGLSDDDLRILGL